MDDDSYELRPDDPYNKMETAKDEVRPDFVKKTKGALGDLGKRASKVALTAAEAAAGVSPEQLLSGGKGGDVTKSVGIARGLHKKSDEGNGKGTKKNGKVVKFSMAFLFVIILIAILLIMTLLTNPAFLARHLDMALQAAARFPETSAVIVQQSIHISQESLMNGRMPEMFASDLAMHGIEVGQMTLAGEFVRTNVFLADLDENNGAIASDGDNYSANGSNGELVVRFKDRIIKGSEFVAAVESDPELYGEYSDAFDVDTRFYYSDEVSGEYYNLGISRGNFNSWVPTGDKETDQENFNEQFANAIDVDSLTYVNGYNGSGGGEDSSASVDIPSRSSSSGIELAAKTKTNTSAGTSKNNNGTNSYELLDGYGNLTFYGPDAASNGGYAGRNGTESINGGALADGQVARDTRDGGILAFGDIIYIETSADPGAEGSYANGKYFIVADTGGETAHSSKWDIDVFVDEPNPSALNGAPYGSIPDAKIYKVASGVSWEEYLSTYYGKSGGIVGKKSCKKGSVTESDEGFTVCIGCDASSTIIDRIGSRTVGDNSTKKAAQLMSVALSSSVPRKAGAAFTAVEEVLQQTAILGDNSSNKFAKKRGVYSLAEDFAEIGDQPEQVIYNASAPITQLMYLLNQRQEVTYTDATTHKEITKNESILENDNFVAVVSNGELNRREAQNFQLDGVLYASGTADVDVIHDTTSVARNQTRSNSVLRIGDGDSADLDQLSGADSNLQFAFSQLSSEIFPGIVGANWIPQGASFMNNLINQRLLGALGSDAQTIEAYHREIDELLERKAVADRATRNPFDISSKNTFLGNIVYNLASSFIANNRGITSGASTWSALKTVSELVDKSTGNFLNTVVADGPRKDFASALGSNCFTVNSVSVEGDFYCNQYTTLVTSFMEKTAAEWESIIDEDLLEDFAIMWASRESTLGIKDARVCEYWKDKYQGVFDRILDAMSNMVGLYDSCRGVKDNDALGVNFTKSGGNGDMNNAMLYAGYTLYDTVYSLMNNTASHVAKIREDYYKKYPLDQSPEGRLARISGLTKEEARLAINYANYLTMVASYDPVTRFVFGSDSIDAPRVVEFIDDKEVESSIYLAWFSKIEYSDVRNRSFVV